MDYHKHIGVFYDTKMKFDHHVNYLVEKATKRFCTLRYLSKRLSYKIVLSLYKTYVMPILEYTNLCLVSTNTQSKQLEKVQKMVTRYICGKSGVNDLAYHDRLKYLGIDSLETRRNIQLLKLLFKIKYRFNDIQFNWTDLVQFYEHNRLGYFARSRLNRLFISDKNVFDHCIKLYNALPKDIRDETNLCNFEHKLYNHMNML